MPPANSEGTKLVLKDTATNTLTTIQVTNNSLTGASGVPADGSVTDVKLATNAVTSTKIAASAVDDSKITGLSGSKLTGSITSATIPGVNVTGTVASASSAAAVTGTVTAANLSAMSSANLITNGGFNAWSGSPPDSWTVSASNGSVDKVGDGQSTSIRLSPPYAAQLTGTALTSPTVTLSQNIAASNFASGDVLVLKWWHRDAPSSDHVIRARIIDSNGNSTFSQTGGASTSWTFHQISRTLGSITGNVTVQFAIDGVSVGGLSVHTIVDDATLEIQ